MADDVKPTRAEELRLKNQIELAESGHSILEKKRDSLIHSFMELANEASDFQGEMADMFVEAKKARDRALAFEGVNKLRSVAMAVDSVPSIQLESENIMGVQVPRISADISVSAMHERGYSLLSTSGVVDDAVETYEELLQTIIEYAETETALIKLLEEIDATRRRVNALEEKVIPEMHDSLDYVSQVLEESDREETFRMKKIKEKQEDEE